MKTDKKIEFKFERMISAPPGEVYTAWLNPKVKGNIWNLADKLVLSPKVGSVYYLSVDGIPHYGRFIKLERPYILQHAWVSPATSGEESLVTVTFKKQGKGTFMTLVHADLPDTEEGRGHEKGWNYFLDIFPKQFGNKSRKKKRNTFIKN